MGYVSKLIFLFYCCVVGKMSKKGEWGWALTVTYSVR